MLPSLKGCYSDDILNLGRRFYSPYTGIGAGDIYNTSHVIEGTTFLDLIAQLESTQNKKQWAIGPILPTKRLHQLSNKDNICLVWLNKQPPKSVLYISFGTSTSFSDEQIKELAMGIEQSKQKFIWVLRDADKGDIFPGKARKLELPEGFEERVKGVGLVVREWEKYEELVNASTVENVVTKLMASEEGDAIRKKQKSWEKP
ncbi:zeatin O-xylosyltransferase-like [Nicotiana tabacum]|uniref:Zeatin O-xylosyltransferase-like n=1 Tax=Nicotiana tabacum TaxID=4097 RepID=A0A1S3ZB75_TOBAC|nr:PREDICTED: zeatin O-xylosyltransferase-like [Nicotiana tabacum]XP_018631150.1 zeatin O-xylosyltransferase-like [Nicotiana tomentosiformis]